MEPKRSTNLFNVAEFPEEFPEEFPVESRLIWGFLNLMQGFNVAAHIPVGKKRVWGLLH